MKSKNLLVLLVTALVLTCGSCSDCIRWTEHLGNPQKTGYSACGGPDAPVELWKVRTTGDFETSPFIMNGKVIVLWKNSQYHTLTAKVMILDVLTGEILHEMDSLLFSEVFPVGDRIIGRSGIRFYEIDIAAGTNTLLTEIPRRGYSFDQYPVILKNKIVIPTFPSLCLTFDFDIRWDMGDTEIDPHLRLYNVAGDEDILGFILAEEGITQLYVVDTSTGILQWMSGPLPSSLWLTIGNDTLYCGGEKLWAFGQNGSERWSFSPEKRIMSNLVLGLDGIFFADEANNLYKIDFDGNLIWKTGWEVSPWYYKTHLIGAGTILYCIGNYGNPDFPSKSSITAFSMEDGIELWNLEFEHLNYVKAFPAIAEGILILGTIGGNVIALASDPDVFVRQGDAFLSKGITDEAITSFTKAAELFEKEGNAFESQKIRERIHELDSSSEFLPESSPPEHVPPGSEPSEPPSTPSFTTSPETTPEESTSLESLEIDLNIPTLLIGLAGAFIAVSVAYHLTRNKKTWKG
jgi:outer membrane protein assembly factor BamB